MFTMKFNPVLTSLAAALLFAGSLAMQDDANLREKLRERDQASELLMKGITKELSRGEDLTELNRKAEDLMFKADDFKKHPTATPPKKNTWSQAIQGQARFEDLTVSELTRKAEDLMFAAEDFKRRPTPPKKNKWFQGLGSKIARPFKAAWEGMPSLKSSCKSTIDTQESNISPSPERGLPLGEPNMDEWVVVEQPAGCRASKSNPSKLNSMQNANNKAKRNLGKAKKIVDKSDKLGARGKE